MATNLGLIGELRAKIQQLEGCRRRGADEVCAGGLGGLERLLPQGGLAGGGLTEWLSDEEGTGAATLALFLAARLQEQGGAVVVIDPRREFYPPAAQALGMVLERTVVVQTRQERETLWAWEQALRSSAVSATLGWLDRLNDRAFRRLQLAAETGGSVGFLVRPFSCHVEPTWAEARLLVEPLPSDSPLSFLKRRLRVQWLHGRGEVKAKSVELELSDETGVVHLAPSLAHSASAARATGA